MIDADLVMLMQIMQEQRKYFNAIESDISKIHETICSLNSLLQSVEEFQFDVSNEKQRFENQYHNLLIQLGFASEEEYEGDEDLEEPIEEPYYIYFILNAEKDKVKIGISKDPEGRAKALQTSSGEVIEILHTIYFPNRGLAQKGESALHQRFKAYRKRGLKVSKTCEWFDAKIVSTLMSDYSTSKQILTLVKGKTA